MQRTYKRRMACAVLAALLIPLGLFGCSDTPSPEPAQSEASSAASLPSDVAATDGSADSGIGTDGSTADGTTAPQASASAESRTAGEASGSKAGTAASTAAHTDKTTATTRRTAGSTTAQNPYNEKYYYIDTAGDNRNSGHSPAEAWKDFTPLNELKLGPGNKVLLKRGCEWNQRLNLHARGTEGNFAEIAAYGSGNARPVIKLNGDKYERCLFLYDPAYVKLSDIEVCNAGAGITLYYDHSYNNRSVYLDNILAHDFRGNSEGTGKADRLAWSTGIDVTGVESSEHDQTRVLTDLRITHTEIYNTGCAIALGWFNHTCVDGKTALCNKFGDVYMSDLYLHDNTVSPVSFTSLFISSVTGCTVENTQIERGCKYAVTGTAAIHNLYTKDVTFRNITVRDTPRADCPDNVGFDFECDTENTLIENCTFENNAGSAIMFLANNNTVADAGHNPQTRGAVIRNCTFIKNDWAQKHMGCQIFLDSYSNARPEVEIYNCKYQNAPGTRFVGGTADTSKVKVHNNTVLS